MATQDWTTHHFIKILVSIKIYGISLIVFVHLQERGGMGFDELQKTLDQGLNKK